MKKSYILLLIVFLFFKQASATHIIGGYIEYTHLSGNDYQIHLVVYRDCLNGVPPFDQPATIGMFTDTGSYLGLFDLNVNDSLPVFIQGPCIPGNVCVVKANYYDTITIPPSGNIILAYQRCCRSASIINVLDPGDHGMAFYTVINPLVQNSSPAFEHEFPAFTYVGDNFSFDASATDPDGDVLVYSLDNAHDGASLVDPIMFISSIQTYPPPYDPLVWAAGYSTNDMLGGVPLTIDSNTGVMTAVPGTIGVFVVSQKVEEYRSGNLINTSRREFVIAVNPGAFYNSDGVVYADNGALPLDVGKAWLIRKNLLDSTLTAVDTNAITNGNYLHPQAINGTYLIKGSADSISPFYASNIPTYYGDVLFWYDATEVNLCTGNVSGIDIHLVQGVNPGGPGFIGGLISQGANRSSSVTGSMEGITIILFNMSNQPVAYAVTDANGNFGIGNLPIGDYKVYVDRLNYVVDNSIAPIITVTSISPVQNNLSFLLHSTWLEHNGNVSVSEIPKSNPAISIHPNPATENLYVSSDSGSLYGMNYSIFNLLGEEIMHGKLNSNQINIAALPSQVYLLRIDLKIGSEYLRFVKIVTSDK